MIVAWTVGLALLAWLLSHTPLSEVREAIARPSALTWALTLGGLLLSYGLRAAVVERDRAICTRCGTDCGRLRRVLA